VAAAYRPAGSGEEVGGDFYDVFELAPDDWVVVIGDVMGKGVEAAVVTALTRYTIRAAAVRSRRPREVLATLNEVLLSQGGDRFCTAAVVRVSKVADGSWSATVASAGHPLPILVRDGRPPVVVGAPGSLAGVLDEIDLTETEVPLPPGSALLLFTDGVTEGRRGGGFFGDDRLLASAGRHGATPAALVAGVLDDVLRFQEHRPADDIAIVGIGA